MSAHDNQVGGDHYRNMVIQPYEFALANDLGAMELQVLRYICRWRKKNGVQDLQKAIHVLELMIEWESRVQ